MPFNIINCTSASEPDEYRDWFEQWKKFVPWKTRRSSVLDRLDALSRGYRDRYDSRQVTLTSDSPLFRKLLYALTYHWTRMENAPPADEEATIESLEKKGRGGSNPLDDLTLVDSMLAEIHENRVDARRFMQERFGGFAIDRARKMGLHVSSNLDDCDWWLNAYYSMVGLMGNKPALGTYAGRAGLGTWIKMVVYSANRPNARAEALVSSQQGEDELSDAASNVVQKGRFSPDVEAQIREFSDALKEFWLTLSPTERAITLYWNEKTPRRFGRASRAQNFRGVWELPEDDVREAYKLCGVGLRARRFVLDLVARRKAFLQRFDFDDADAGIYVPLYWSGLERLAEESPVSDHDVAADLLARFGAPS